MVGWLDMTGFRRRVTGRSPPSQGERVKGGVDRNRDGSRTPHLDPRGSKDAGKCPFGSSRKACLAASGIQPSLIRELLFRSTALPSIKLPRDIRHEGVQFGARQVVESYVLGGTPGGGRHFRHGGLQISAWESPALARRYFTPCKVHVQLLGCTSPC